MSAKGGTGAFRERLSEAWIELRDGLILQDYEEKAA